MSGDCGDWLHCWSEQCQIFITCHNTLLGQIQLQESHVHFENICACCTNKRNIKHQCNWNCKINHKTQKVITRERQSLTAKKLQAERKTKWIFENLYFFPPTYFEYQNLYILLYLICSLLVVIRSKIRAYVRQCVRACLCTCVRLSARTRPKGNGVL